jgi:peptidoglycan hydrolase-like protein with peptidoglycan-binding domain
MIKNRIAKIAAFSVGITFALGVVATPAGAQTIAELQAQINALMAQLAALQGGTVAPASTTFTPNLTVGSTGSEVTSLQQALVSQGHLVMPTGVPMGFFGPLTQAAVAKWQAASGVSPAVGYWGPISRAAYAASAGGSAVTPGVTPGVGVITTPGVEGTITATLDSNPTAVKLYEGDSRKQVMGIKLEAKTSDMRVERLKLKLDATGGTGDTDFYRKIASRIYVMDGSNVLGTADLNANTVVKEGSDYFITISGFGFVIPKNTTRSLFIALDAMNTWDSGFDSQTQTLTLVVDGARAVDGAGINQFSPSTAFARNFTSEGELATSATLKVTLNINSPKANEIIADKGVDNDEKDDVELLKFDVKAEKDAVEITDLTVALTNSNNTAGATTTTLYLYDGNTRIGAETANIGASGNVVFDDIDYVVPRDVTKTFTVKVDVRDATAAATVLTATVNSGSAIVAENTIGDVLGSSAKTGSATGESVTVRKVGLQFSLVSKNIVKGVTPLQNNISTSTAEATFTLRVTALGGDILLGTAASSTPIVTNNGNDGTNDGQSFVIYLGGAAQSALVSASTTGIEIPTTGTTAAGSNTRQLSDGGSIDIPVSFLFHGRAASSALVTSGSYSVGLEKINWVSSGGLQHSTFMSSDSTTWRTGTVSLP